MVVLVLLIVAVVGQSVALVKRRAVEDEFVAYRMDEDGRIVKIRELPPRFGTPPSSIELRRGTSSSTKRNKPVILDEQEVLHTWSIESKMLPDKESAMKDAIDQAQSRLMHELGLSVAPSPEFIRTKMMTNYNDHPGKQFDDVKTMKVTFDLELTRGTKWALDLIERDFRTRDRMETGAKLVAILTVLLGCIAGYIRFDEWTKGYYTGRLRVLMVVLAGLASLGIARIGN
jgi:hypothetical protein